MKQIIVIITAIVLTGCAGSRKLPVTDSDIIAHRQELEKMQGSVQTLDQKRAAKWEKGELDETTDSVIRNYIAKLKDSIDMRLKQFDALADHKALRKNIKSATAWLNNVKESYQTELSNILFFDDLFETTTFSRLNTAAFFASGQYLLSDTSYGKARAVMNEIVTDALQFSARYSSRKLRALFIVTGYADEENIGQGSELWESLTTSLSASGETERKQLNKELSLRRAAGIKDILAREYYLLSKRHPSDNLATSFLALGKGEELPRGQFTGFKPVDERRRVVLLYWSILPKL